MCWYERPKGQTLFFPYYHKTKLQLCDMFDCKKDIKITDGYVVCVGISIGGAKF